MELLLALVVGLALAAIYFLPPPPPDDGEDLDGPFDDLFNRSWSDWRD